MLIFDVAVVQTIKPPDKAPYRFKLDTKRVRWPMSALGQKADMCNAIGDVRFVPIADMRHSFDHLAALRGRRRHDVNGVVIR
jgi:hypothetical protein